MEEQIVQPELPLFAKELPLPTPAFWSRLPLGAEMRGSEEDRSIRCIGCGAASMRSSLFYVAGRGYLTYLHCGCGVYFVL